ncbi:MAG: isoprenylcysteine carboxylmethyltransferase family protein [Clostridia bacterium]|nr:isoprenylcysteine carboxylmethyltransferase family protein [Clostridia bacterium]
MTKKLLLKACGKLFAGLVIIALLLFLPAGTIGFYNGWMFIVILFVPMIVAGVVLMKKNPALLEKRLNAKEKEDEQKSILLLSGLMFLAAFISAGLCYRFHFLVIPLWLAKTGAVIFLAAYVMYAEVLRENTYLSRTVEVQENQKVIDTGLYGVMRHPMYCSTLFLFLSMGIVLGSVISFAVLLFYIPIIAKRIKNEEQVLEEGLEGYAEYKERVKYKVIPFIW